MYNYKSSTKVCNIAVRPHHNTNRADETKKVKAVALSAVVVFDS